MRTTFVCSFHIAVPTGFKVVLYLITLVYTNGMIMDMKRNTHWPYKTGSRSVLTFFIMPSVWKQLPRKSGIGSFIKDLKLYMLFNGYTLLYGNLPHYDDGYALTDQRK